MTKIAKGVEIYMFSRYDETTCCVRKAMVTSFGKRQGTAIGSENGEPIEHRLYAENEKDSMFNAQGLFNGVALIPVVDVPDVSAKAMQFAAVIKQWFQDHYRDVQHKNADAPDGYHRSVSASARRQYDAPAAIITRL